MKRNLRKAVVAALGTAAMAGVSTRAAAWTTADMGVYTAGSPLSITDETPFKAWSDYNSDGAFHNMSWAHTSDWLKVQIGSASQIASGARLDVQFTIQGKDTGKGNASRWTGFTLWTTGTSPVKDAGTGTAHAYVQTRGPQDGPSNANIPSAGGFPNGVIDYPNYGLNDGGTGSCGVNGGSCSNVLLGRAGWVGYGNTGLGFDWTYEDDQGARKTGDHVLGQASSELGGAFNPSVAGTGSRVDNSVPEQIALNLCGLKAGYYLINIGGVCPNRDLSCLTGGSPGNPTSGNYAGTGGNARGYTFSVGPAECQTAPPPPPPSDKYSLTVGKAGSGGTGKVVSSPEGIDCGTVCDAEFAKSSSVKLTATPDAGSKFDQWTGCTSVTGSECTVVMDKDGKSVTAQFAAESPPPEGKYALSVTHGGNGKVSSNPAGIDCGATCSAFFDQGASVTLTAVPDEGYQFDGWSGACSGIDPCTVLLNEGKNVTAAFTAAGGSGPYALTVSKRGSGLVTSSPAGIDCGSACSASFDGGALVTLTAAPEPGWRFAGWDGACGVLQTCTLTMNTARNLTATFARAPLRDYDGDGRADLLWREAKTGRNNLWLMIGRNLKASGSLPEKGKGWFIAAVADFDGDHNADVLWHRRATGQNHLWLMKAGTVKSIVVLPDQAAEFSAIRSGDFDRDGTPDVLWHNPSTGEVRLSLMDGPSYKGAAALPAAPPGYSLAEVADFNGDRSLDVWWYNRATGESSLWLMAGPSVQSIAAPPAQAPGWRLAGAGLFDDDAKADILWRNPVSGENQLWMMDGANRNAVADLAEAARVWFPAGVDDFNGDGKPEILWRNRRSGKNRLWVMDGVSLKRKAPVTAFSKGWVTPAH